MYRKILFSIGIILSLVGFAGFFFSCGSAPAASGGPRPAWVTSTPEDTEESVYFVGVGSSETGDVAAAENSATITLLAEITRFLGVRITAETTLEARDTLETFEEELTQKIRQESAAQIGDFRVREKWIDRQGDQVTVYILGVYDRDALLEEQERIRQVFAEQQEAVSGPELEGDNLASEGNHYMAALKYIEAASAAATSRVDNADIKLERNINKAKQAIDKINLIPLNNNLTTNVGELFTESFDGKLVSGSSKDAPGVTGANIRVVYKEMQRNGRMGIESTVIQTDGSGMVSFKRPAPKFVGKEQITMLLDFGSYMEALEDAPDQFQQYVEGLEELINGKRVDFQYTVVSRAKEISTGIVMVDVDRAGNQRNYSDSQAGLLETLTEAGFRVRPLTVDFRLQDTSDDQIIARIRAAYGGQIQRVIFGVASISEFQESDGNFIVKVSGSVKAADLGTGDILYTTNSFKRSMGNNTQSALSAAFKGLGRELGQAMTSGLP